jgi:hypothetical protein
VCQWNACTVTGQTRGSDGICRCPAEQSPVNGVCQWNPCRAEQTRVNGVCQWNPCPTDRIRAIDGKCILDCTLGGYNLYYYNKNDVCMCPDAYTLRNNTQCEFTGCGTGRYYDAWCGICMPNGVPGGLCF